jgi:glycosyltransferase involved in cell wall biosynthesis
LKILLIAPEPFFEERGTPIAVDLLASALSRRGDRVDLLTTHLGEDRSYPGFTLVRVKPPFAPKRIPPGFSLAKIYCDFFMLVRTLRITKRGAYDLVHAVEEASFMAWLANLLGGPPYVVDIDSSMTTQIVQRQPWLSWAEGVLRWLEQLPWKRATAAVAVCDALSYDARRLCPGETVVIPDVSLTAEDPLPADDVREIIRTDDPIVMYIGNLEPYQGIDLLLSTFSSLNQIGSNAQLVVIGGVEEHIEKYRNRAQELRIEERVHFIGPRPVAALEGYLRQADVLVSPRIEGVNTPMKIYSYMNSGRPLVATDITSHNQLLDERYAVLAPPEPVAFSEAIQQILDNEGKATRIAAAARDLVAREHSPEAFVKRVHALYDEMEAAWVNKGSA